MRPGGRAPDAVLLKAAERVELVHRAHRAHHLDCRARGGEGPLVAERLGPFVEELGKGAPPARLVAEHPIASALVTRRRAPLCPRRCASDEAHREPGGGADVLRHLRCRHPALERNRDPVLAEEALGQIVLRARQERVKSRVGPLRLDVQHCRCAERHVASPERRGDVVAHCLRARGDAGRLLRRPLRASGEHRTQRERRPPRPGAAAQASSAGAERRAARAPLRVRVHCVPGIVSRSRRASYSPFSEGVGRDWLCTSCSQLHRLAEFTTDRFRELLY